MRSVGLVVEEGTAYFKNMRIRALINPREPFGKPPGFASGKLGK